MRTLAWARILVPVLRRKFLKINFFYNFCLLHPRIHVPHGPGSAGCALVGCSGFLVEHSCFFRSCKKLWNEPSYFWNDCKTGTLACKWYHKQVSTLNTLDGHNITATKCRHRTFSEYFHLVNELNIMNLTEFFILLNGRKLCTEVFIYFWQS